MRPLLCLFIVLTPTFLDLITKTYYEKLLFYSLNKTSHNDKKNTSITIGTIGSFTNILPNALYVDIDEKDTADMKTCQTKNVIMWHETLI